MPAKHIEVKTFKLAHTTDDVVKIEHVEKPYGEYSSPVVSIAVYSQGKTKVSEVENNIYNEKDEIERYLAFRGLSDREYR